MLDAFAVVARQEVRHLPGAAADGCGVLVQRNADLVVWRGHRPGNETGVSPGDVEAADLAELEQAFVEGSPVIHAPTVHVVGEVIDDLEAGAGGVAIGRVGVFEVDVVDAAAFLVAVDQVQGHAAQAANCRQPELHRSGRHIHALRAEGDGTGVGLVRVADPKCQAGDAGAVLLGEIPGGAAWFVVDDEVDAVLPPQVYGLGTVTGDPFEPELAEYRLEDALFGGGEFDELEPVESHGVVATLHCVSLVHGLRSTLGPSLRNCLPICLIYWD